MTTDRNSEGAGLPNPERVAQLIAHRATHAAEHNPEAGRLHGYCLVCGIPWPCEYAGTPPAAGSEVAIICDWKDADPFPRLIEAEINGRPVSLEWRGRPDGLKELIVPTTTPPASIPAAEVQALVEDWQGRRANLLASAQAMRDHGQHARARKLEADAFRTELHADELAKLIPRNPE